MLNRIVVFSWRFRGSMIVEAKDVRFFDVAEVNNAGKRTVHIDGLVFHSSLAVEHIESRRGVEDITVEVFLTPAKKGLSGRFTIDVALDENVRRILFGPSAVQIWPNPRV